jgi:hypothetical protein
MSAFWKRCNAMKLELEFKSESSYQLQVIGFSKLRGKTEGFGINFFAPDENWGQAPRITMEYCTLINYDSASFTDQVENMLFACYNISSRNMSTNHSAQVTEIIHIYLSVVNISKYMIQANMILELRNTQTMWRMTIMKSKIDETKIAGASEDAFKQTQYSSTTNVKEGNQYALTLDGKKDNTPFEAKEDRRDLNNNNNETSPISDDKFLKVKNVENSSILFQNQSTTTDGKQLFTNNEIKGERGDNMDVDY